MEASARLQNELSSIQKSRPFGFYARPAANDSFTWLCQFHSGGYFYRVRMLFSASYPIQPPRLFFDHQVFHPNVYTDKSVCLDILSYKWTPTLTIMDILKGLMQLLEYPNPLSPANPLAAKLFLEDRAEYNLKVEANNKKYWSKYRTYKRRLE